MKTIWKFTFGAIPRQSFDMPEGAEVLAVQMQGDELCLWALAEPGNKTTARAFTVYGTGLPIDYAVTIKTYCGTVQINGYVFHVFELR